MKGQHCENGPEWRNSGGANGLAQADYFLSKHTNKYSLHCRCKRGRDRDRVTRNERKQGMEQHPIPIKKPFSNKQLSSVSSTRKIQKSKKDATHTHVRRCGPIFLCILSTIWAGDNDSLLVNNLALSRNAFPLNRCVTTLIPR